MKHAVIVAHPNPHSLACAVGKTYAETARALGQTVIVRDLYRIGCDPCLQADEIPKASGFQPGADVVAERQQLADVDVFAFVYPLWFNAPPAILKGYVDRRRNESAAGGQEADRRDHLRRAGAMGPGHRRDARPDDPVRRAPVGGDRARAGSGMPSSSRATKTAIGKQE